MRTLRIEIEKLTPFWPRWPASVPLVILAGGVVSARQDTRYSHHRHHHCHHCHPRCHRPSMIVTCFKLISDHPPGQSSNSWGFLFSSRWLSSILQSTQIQSSILQSTPKVPQITIILQRSGTNHHHHHQSTTNCPGWSATITLNVTDENLLINITNHYDMYVQCSL